MEKLVKLFEPGKMGKVEVKNRILMAPLGPMMEWSVCVRPAWSWAEKSGTALPTSGPVLIFWPNRAAANKVIAKLLCIRSP